MASQRKKEVAGFTVDLLRRCELDREPSTVRAPERGHEFPAGIQRQLAQLLDLLGWNRAAEFFLPTPDTVPLNFVDPVVEVPRAGPPAGFGQVRIRFQASQNATLMLKEFSIAAANETAALSGEVIFAEGQRTASARDRRFEERLGVQRQLGRWVNPGSVVIANGGIYDIVLRNFDPLSVARYCVAVRAWEVQR